MSRTRLNRYRPPADQVRLNRVGVRARALARAAAERAEARAEVNAYLMTSMGVSL